MKLFEKYRHNQADDKEQAAMTELFIKHKYDQELRQKMTQRLAQQYGIKRDDNATTGRIRLLQFIRWGTSIAAAVLVGLAIWQVAQPQLSYQELTTEYLSVYTASNERRKGAEDISEQRTAAIDAYSARDFVRSAQLRQVVVDSEEAIEDDYFYLGLSYLYQTPPQAEAAITALQDGLALPASELAEEIRWYLSLAYLKADRLQEAQQQLQQIVDQKWWNAKKAKKLLKALPEQ